MDDDLQLNAKPRDKPSDVISPNTQLQHISSALILIAPLKPFQGYCCVDVWPL